MNSLERLTIRCILPGFVGTSLPEWVRRREGEGLGGVVLFARNIESREQVSRLNAALHAERPELLIAVDEEGGDVTRLEARTGSSYPGNLALGASNDANLTTSVAASMGAELRELGFDLDLAPVADVNSNPNNPVIGVRSFGSDPELVARQTAAWTRGLQKAGVAATAKHFPGHGDTSIDSHLALPVAEGDFKAALMPFRAAIEAGVQAIMSAHIVVPALDTLPATISRRIMTGVLREELGFQGLAVTDGLEMRGLSADRGVAEGAVEALAAGCDGLCIGGGLAGEETVDQIVSAVVAAVKAGKLAQDRLEEAASRVDALANWRLNHADHPSVSNSTGLEAARRAICCHGRVHVGDHAVVIRFDSAPSLASGREMQWGVADALQARGVQITSADNDVAGQDLVLVVRNLHRWPEQRHVVDAMLERRSDAIVVEMGLPIYEPPAAGGYIATRGAARVCAQAAAEVMRP